MGGVVLSESVTTKNDPILIKAGTGTLTVKGTKSLSTTGQLLSLVADDLDFDGFVSAGMSMAEVIPYTPNRPMYLGLADVGLSLTDAEFGRIWSFNGIVLGDSSTGSVVVGGITDSNSDSMNLLTLFAKKAGATVAFKSQPSSFNKGIVINTAGGIILEASLSTTNDPTILSAGTGTITVAAGKTLSSTSRALSLTSDDIDFRPSSMVSTGSATLLMSTFSQKSIGVGTLNQQFHMEASEFGAIYANGLVIGRQGVNTGIEVSGVSNTQSSLVTGIVTILSTMATSQLMFTTTTSTFHSLSAQSSNGIVVNADITTTTGALYLNTDVGNIEFADGRTVTSKTLMTLQTATGRLNRAGSLTLKSGGGILLSNSMVGGVTGQSLVVHTGYDLTEGTFTVLTSKSIITSGSVLITAMDVDLQGTMNTGSSTLTVLTSAVGRTIGLGVSQQDLWIDAIEVQHISSLGLTIGGGQSGTVTVGGITAANSGAINGVISISAVAPGAQILFTSQQSDFYGMSAIANNGIIAQSDLITNRGFVTLEGGTSISVSGNRILQAGKLLTLGANGNGRIVRSGIGVLQLKGGDGILMNDNFVSQTPGQPIVILADANSSGNGKFSLNNGCSINSNNGEIAITAGDIEIGFLVSGSAPTKISVSKDGLEIGFGTAIKDLSISGAELQQISATGLVIGSSRNGMVTIEGVTGVQSATIGEVVSILATKSNQQIVFAKSESKFNALAAQAGNGIEVNSDVATVVQDVIFDGDQDITSTGMFADQLKIANDLSMTSMRYLRISSVSGGITHVGSLTLAARDGIAITSSMKGQQIERQLRLLADTDSNGNGTLTLGSGVAVNSMNSMISVTAADFVFLGSLAAGSQGIDMQTSGNDRTIGIGATSQQMHLTDSELRMLSAQYVTIGNTLNSNFVVNGVSDGSSTNLGTLTLVATKAGRTITFGPSDSFFNKGIVVKSMSGVLLTGSLTTKNSDTFIIAGFGTFTIAAGKSMRTSNQTLLLTCDGIDLQPGSVINTGLGIINQNSQSSRTVGFGAYTEQMNINLSMLPSFFTAGFTLGYIATAGRPGSPNGSIKVESVPASASSGVTDFISLIACVDNSRITFVGAPSTFPSLAAQADDGITAGSDITTTSGYLHLNSDLDSSSVGDNDNSIWFTLDQQMIMARTTITLQAFSGSIIRSGALTLKAGAGINMFNNLLSSASNKALVLNADYDSPGDGVFTVMMAKVLDSNSGAVAITATDIDFAGFIKSSSLTINTSLIGGTMSLGSAFSSLALAKDELQNVAATGFVFGSQSNGDITVAGVTAASSKYLQSIVTLVATGSDSKVQFTTNGSTFNALSAQAGHGMVIDVDLSSLEGSLMLQGDDAFSSTPTYMTLTGQRSIRGQGLFTIKGMTSSIKRLGSGLTTFRSGTGVVVGASMTSTNSGQPVVINSDDSGGVYSATYPANIGIFTLMANKVMDTAHGQIYITATEVDLRGSLNSGSATLMLGVSRTGSPMNLGGSSVSGGFTLSSNEVGRVSAGGLLFGNANNGSITVNGISNTDSSKIVGIVSLLAISQGSSVFFNQFGSTFSAISVVTDNGIDVMKSLSTTTGSIILNGDFDNRDDGSYHDYIKFGSDLVLNSNVDIDLKAKTGGIILEGPIQLLAKGFINIHNQFTGPFGSYPVTVNADSDIDGVGSVSVNSAACSIYSTASSCVASRLCGWCGDQGNTIANGVVSTSGALGDQLDGTNTSFLSDSSFAIGNLITIEGQTREITAVQSETSATIESRLVFQQSGFLSIYAGALDQVVGSTKTKFTKEVKVGNTLTIGSNTAEVTAVDSYNSLQLTAPALFSASNALYTIGNIEGAGSMSTDGGLSLIITGSWPPYATKFLTTIKEGSVITVGGESRIVASVANNQLLTVTTPFTEPFTSQLFTISNIEGTGTVTFQVGSIFVAGSDLASTAFTTQLRVGDLIAYNGNSKIVSSIRDDYRLSLSSSGSLPVTNVVYDSGNTHTSAFTISKKATGNVYTTGTLLIGLGTHFAAELASGFKITLKTGRGYESRVVRVIQTDTTITLDSALVSDILVGDATKFFYQSCPSQTPSFDASSAGTFAFHAKASRPGLCFMTGKCVPKAAHRDTFETVGIGSIVGTSTSNIISGTGTNFITQIPKVGLTLAVYTSTKMESRQIMQVTSASSLILDRPFSFDITPVSSQPFLIQYLTGKGAITNTGASDFVVTGTGTTFLKDLAVGFIIAVGIEKRMITSIRDDYYMKINAPFNYINGGTTNSGYAFEACFSGGVSPVKQLTYDYAALLPGCCGFQASGAVSGGNFAYFRVVPPSSNYNFRVITTSSHENLEVYVRYSFAPDAANYDYKAVSMSSPWQVELPQNRLSCPTNGGACDPLWIGVKGLSSSTADISFEVASYLEFNFQNFACLQSLASSLSAKCQSLGLRQISSASFVEQSDPLNKYVMRLTSDSSQRGAVWFGTKVHVEDGFETVFDFRISSTLGDGSSSGDGFAFVIHSNDNPDQLGCGGKGLGFASDSSLTTCAGVANSLAVEFDTWHNKDLKDINARGVGTSEVNATTVTTFSYVHTAFFSNGELPNTNSHTTQLAGTPAIPVINDGNWHSARVVYIPGTTVSAPGRLFLYIDDMQSFVLTSPVRLTRSGACGFANTDRCVLDTFGNAFMGFTASSGDTGQNHDVSKWLFCDEPGCGRN